MQGGCLAVHADRGRLEVPCLALGQDPLTLVVQVVASSAKRHQRMFSSSNAMPRARVR